MEDPSSFSGHLLEHCFAHGIVSYMQLDSSTDFPCPVMIQFMNVRDKRTPIRD